MPIHSPDSDPGTAPTPTARIRRTCFACPRNRHNGWRCRRVNPQRWPDHASYASRRIAGKESPWNRRSASSSRLRPGARWFPVDFGFSGAVRVGAMVCVAEEAREINSPWSSFWSGGLAFTAEPASSSCWLGTGVQADQDQPASESDNPLHGGRLVYTSVRPFGFS
jgi:hypothetical protein